MVEKQKGFGKIKNEIYEYIILTFPDQYSEMESESKMDLFFQKWESFYKEEYSKLMNSEQDAIYYLDYSDFECYCRNAAYTKIFNRISDEFSSFN
jgi:hypothetical protein